MPELLTTNPVKRCGPAPALYGLAMLAALAALPGCGRAPEATVPEVRPVRVVTVAEANLGSDAVLTGRIQARAEVNQSFRLGGQLIERNVDVGDSVRSGQMLARLDSQNEQSGLQAAQAQRVAAQVQLVDARNNFNRMRSLIGENAVSRASYDHADALLKTAEAQVRAVESQVELAQSRVDFTRLVADVSGVVTARGAEVGEVVSAGRMIVQIAQAGAREAVLDVPAPIKNVAGRDALIRVELTSDPGIFARGRIREVSPRADPVTGTFLVRVALSDTPPQMRLGSTVTARLALASIPGITIPAAAVTRSNGKPAVWIVDRQTMTVALRNITVRASDSTSITIAAGLAPGDTIVTAGVQALRPGQKVRLLDAAVS